MSEPQVFERIRDEIGKNDVLLFMKGTPVFPQCGFSAAVVEVLSELGVKFHGVNILVDPELRQGIKEFSQWPTIPQLYVEGRVRRRLRHHPRDVRDRRARAAPQGQGRHAGQRRLSAQPRPTQTRRTPSRDSQT